MIEVVDSAAIWPVLVPLKFATSEVVRAAVCVAESPLIWVVVRPVLA